MMAAANNLYVDKDAWKYIEAYKKDRISVIENEAKVKFVPSEHDGVLQVSVVPASGESDTFLAQARLEELVAGTQLLIARHVLRLPSPDRNAQVLNELVKQYSGILQYKQEDSTDLFVLIGEKAEVKKLKKKVQHKFGYIFIEPSEDLAVGAAWGAAFTSSQDGTKSKTQTSDVIGGWQSNEVPSEKSRTQSKPRQTAEEDEPDPDVLFSGTIPKRRSMKTDEKVSVKPQPALGSADDSMDDLFHGTSPRTIKPRTKETPIARVPKKENYELSPEEKRAAQITELLNSGHPDAQDRIDELLEKAEKEKSRKSCSSKPLKTSERAKLKPQQTSESVDLDYTDDLFDAANPQTSKPRAKAVPPVTQVPSQEYVLSPEDKLTAQIKQLVESGDPGAQEKIDRLLEKADKEKSRKPHSSRKSNPRWDPIPRTEVVEAKSQEEAVREELKRIEIDELLNSSDPEAATRLEELLAQNDKKEPTQPNQKQGGLSALRERIKNLPNQERIKNLTRISRTTVTKIKDDAQNSMQELDDLFSDFHVRDTDHAPEADDDSEDEQDKASTKLSHEKWIDIVNTKCPKQQRKRREGTIHKIRRPDASRDDEEETGNEREQQGFLLGHRRAERLNANEIRQVDRHAERQPPSKTSTPTQKATTQIKRTQHEISDRSVDPRPITLSRNARLQEETSHKITREIDIPPSTKETAVNEEYTGWLALLENGDISKKQFEEWNESRKTGSGSKERTYERPDSPDRPSVQGRQTPTDRSYSPDIVDRSISSDSLGEPVRRRSPSLERHARQRSPSSDSGDRQRQHSPSLDSGDRQRQRSPSYDSGDRQRQHSSSSDSFDRPVRQHSPTSDSFDRPVRQRSPSSDSVDRPVRRRSPSLERPVRGRSPSSDSIDRPVRQRSPSSDSVERPVRRRSPSSDSFDRPVRQRSPSSESLGRPEASYSREYPAETQGAHHASPEASLAGQKNRGVKSDKPLVDGYARFWNSERSQKVDHDRSVGQDNTRSDSDSDSPPAERHSRDFSPDSRPSTHAYKKDRDDEKQKEHDADPHSAHEQTNERFQPIQSQDKEGMNQGASHLSLGKNMKQSSSSFNKRLLQTLSALDQGASKLMDRKQSESQTQPPTLSALNQGSSKSMDETQPESQTQPPTSSVEDIQRDTLNSDSSSTPSHSLTYEAKPKVKSSQVLTSFTQERPRDAPNEGSDFNSGASLRLTDGTQPQGAKFDALKVKKQPLPGHEEDFHYEVTITFPGLDESGRFVALLPGSKDGLVVIKLLRKALERRLLFRVEGGELVWNGFTAKSKKEGLFGYPDPDYLERAKRELESLMTSKR